MSRILLLIHKLEGLFITYYSDKIRLFVFVDINCRMTRYVSIGHRLTGWNAVKNRVEQLGLTLTDDQVKQVTIKIKELADIRPLTMEDVDNLLRDFHNAITSGDQLQVDGVLAIGTN